MAVLYIYIEAVFRKSILNNFHYAIILTKTTQKLAIDEKNVTVGSKTNC